MKGAREDPIEREFQLHIDLVTADLMREGWDREAAQAEANRRFGNRRRLRQECDGAIGKSVVRTRLSAFVEGIIVDLRQAVRAGRNAPGFVATAIATLALGIGATTTVFSVVDALVLRPLPYPQSDRMVQVGTIYPGRAEPSSSSPLNFFDWRDQSDAFDYLVASRLESRTILTDGYPGSILGAGVSAGYFELLGATPLLGRGITAADDRPGAPPVVVLRHRAWQSRWAGDPTVIGQTVGLSGQQFTIVGVMPVGFLPPEAIYHRDVDFWFPLADVSDDLNQRDNGFLQVIGRLREDVTPALASATLSALQRRIYESEPTQNERIAAFRSQLRVGVVPLIAQTVGDNDTVILVFLGAVCLLLAGACANVANLFLARSADRGRELALRAALGAGRGRIMRQILTESIALALVAGAVGVGLAVLGVRAFVALAPTDLPRLDEVTVDVRILVFSTAVSVLTGLLFGLAPALRHARDDVRDALQEGVTTVTTGRQRHRLRRALVAIETAVAVILLIGAGLLANSFIRLTAVDPGFDPDGLVHMSLYIGDNYETGQERAAFFSNLVQRIASAPGVVHAAATSDLPMTPNASSSQVTAEEPATGEGTISVEFRRVTPGFFETMGITMRAGRDFAESDRTGIDVAIVSEALGRALWGDLSPIGRRFKFGNRDSDGEWITVIGVVGDVNQHALGTASAPAVYRFHARSPFVFGNVVARGSGDLNAVLGAMRRELRIVDDRQPTEEIGLLRDQMSLTVTRPRFSMTLLLSFGLAAMLIASVGVYGAVSYIVRQRFHEMGIRLALGATTRDIMSLVVRQGITSIVGGIAIGVAVAVPVSRVLQGFVFGITTTDPGTYVSVASLLVGVGVLACLIPAGRAVRVEPALTLRAQ